MRPAAGGLGPMEDRAYLDYNATAPLRPAARTAMLAALDLVGNPSSVHHYGRAARRLVEEARERVAALAGVVPERVVFTSGATEANALALSGRPVVLTSAIEHESVRGWAAGPPIPPTADGVIEPDAVAAALAALGAAAPGTAPPIVAVMAANNETGAVQPVTAIAELVHAAGARLHCDAVQAAGRLDLAPLAAAADTLALSAHKIGGPQGLGALILDEAAAGASPAPLWRGGAQERRWRPGTENVAGIAGFGAAAAEAVADREQAMARCAALRDRLEAALVAAGGIAVAAAVPRLANTLCIAMPGVPAETQVAALDLAGVAVSAGSACSAGAVQRSPVLTAMGLPDTIAGSAIRISLGPETTPAAIDRCIAAWTTLARRRRAA